jgi:hypothetical protein
VSRQMKRALIIFLFAFFVKANAQTCSQPRSRTEIFRWTCRPLYIRDNHRTTFLLGF